MKQQADGTNQEYEAAIDEVEYHPAPLLWLHTIVKKVTNI